MRIICILALLASTFIYASCIGVKSHYDPKTGLNVDMIFDNSALNTSSKLARYSLCDKNKERPENCKPLGTYHSDTTGLIPSIGGQAIQGIAIGVGLESNDHTVNTVGGNTVIDQSCRGNCGGGPK